MIQTSAVLTHVASCALASSVVGSHLVQMGYGFYLLFLPGYATDGKDLLSDPLIAPRSAVGKQPPFCRRRRAAPFTTSTSVASSNIHREKSSITRRWQQSPPLSCLLLLPKLTDLLIVVVEKTDSRVASPPRSVVFY